MSRAATSAIAVPPATSKLHLELEPFGLTRAQFHGVPADTGVVGAVDQAADRRHLRPGPSASE